MRLQWNLDVANGCKYTASRGYIFAVWTGVRKVASAATVQIRPEIWTNELKKRVFSCSWPV